MAAPACHPLEPQPAALWERGERGFTLIELIMVLVLVGVLAVYAVPRMASNSDFGARGFHDQTLAYLRYAQKTAIAQRRPVCVAFTANTVTLTLASAAADVACSTDLPGPKGELVLKASDNVAYAPVPTGFRFDGLGQPLTGTNTPAPTSIQVGTMPRAITVESGTGYVHD